MTQILSNVLAFLFAAGIIIFVHELGHYLVAKACGVRVLTFSLGFGKRLWGFRRGGTDYRIAAVPLGGFVAFDGHDPSDPSDDPAAFLNRPRWQRVLILLAGPVMNLALAILLVAALYVIGTEGPDQRDLSTVVGAVSESSAAADAGLRPGDRLLTIDGEAVEDWQQVSMVFLVSPDRPLPVQFSRDGVELETQLTPQRIPRYDLGFAGVWPAVPPRVSRVLWRRPAARAGFRYGDALRSVDGRPIASGADFSEYVGPRAGQEIEVEVERNGQLRSLRVVPEEVEGKGLIGVQIRPFHYQRLSPPAALAAACRFNYETSREIFAFVGKIFERRIAAHSALGGPIEIAAISGAAARSGYRDLFTLMAIISLNLFLLNLMPVPILDGGQILVLLVEGTLRRDLSLVVKERMTQLGLVMIVMLMAMVLFFDLRKNLPRLGSGGDGLAPAVEQPEEDASGVLGAPEP